MVGRVMARIRGWTSIGALYRTGGSKINAEEVRPVWGKELRDMYARPWCSYSAVADAEGCSVSCPPQVAACPPSL